jgi:hypothetical protein
MGGKIYIIDAGIGTDISINTTGIITASSFSGSGSSLTGIVTSLTAGPGISLNPSTGNVTITATGGGGSSQFVTTAAGIHTLSNVGIGTTNPTNALTVSGVVSATSFVGNLTGTATSTTNIPNLTGDVTSTGNTTSIAAGVIVNDDISASAGIVDTKLATISTAGKVSNSATTATTGNVNAPSAIVAKDSYGNFSAGTITATLNGNASTVTTNANLTGDVTSTGNTTSIAAGVIVNADISASADIADTKLATISTAGKVSNSATTATNANTASTIVQRDGSGNFIAGTITASSFVGPLTGTASGNLSSGGPLGTPSSGNLTNCTFPTLNQSTTGNAATATILQTARTINGVSFNGSANITISANGIVNVKDFGAKGDGNHDDTYFIQLAIYDAISSHNRKSIYFPAGIYRLTNTIYVQNHSSGNGLGSGTVDQIISFVGEGSGISVIRIDHHEIGINVKLTGNWWIINTTNTPSSSGFSIKGMTICANYAPNVPSSHDNTTKIGINIVGNATHGRHQRTFLLDDVDFIAFGNMEKGFNRALQINGHGDIKISNCKFMLDIDLTNHRRYGTAIHINNPNSQDLHFSGLMVSNTDFFFGNKGIETRDFFEGLYVANCSFVNSNYGIYCNVAVAEGGCNIVNSHFATGKDCIYLRGMVQSNISNNLIYAGGHLMNGVDNGGDGADSKGIHILGNSGEYIITGNTIIGGNYVEDQKTCNYGIVIEGSHHHAGRSSLISANYISSFKQYGIWIKSTARHLKIGNNHIWNCDAGLIKNDVNLYDQGGTGHTSIHIHKEHYLETIVYALSPSINQKEYTLLMPIPVGVFRVKPNFGIIQCNSDAKLLCRLDDATTITQAKIVMNMSDGSNIPSGLHRFSVMLSHLSGNTDSVDYSMGGLLSGY